ncbi:MAG: DUF520 family protein [Acidobacteriota bacterium]|nr:DUF520 family protein [Acidobacteriota bacterium]
MMTPRKGRRQFLKRAPVIAGVAAAAIHSTASEALGAEPRPSPEELRAHGERSPFVTSQRIGGMGFWPPTATKVRDYGFRTPLQDSVGMVTPASLHFILSHGFDPPDINPAEHRLLIDGMVDRPLIFSVDDLRRLPSVSRFHYLECHGNSAVGGPTGIPRKAPDATVQQTHGLTSCSEWTGVQVSLLLKEVGVQKGATWIVAEGADVVKHTKSIPMEKAKEIVRLVKDAKLKVQSQIQEDHVRVFGKNRDDLQAVIKSLREHDFGIEVQFTNYRSE